MSQVRGSTVYPLIEQIRDTIEVHGLRWAMTYYYRRMSPTEFRFFMRVAYCG